MYEFTNILLFGMWLTRERWKSANTTKLMWEHIHVCVHVTNVFAYTDLQKWAYTQTTSKQQTNNNTHVCASYAIPTVFATKHMQKLCKHKNNQTYVRTPTHVLSNTPQISNHGCNPTNCKLVNQCIAMFVMNSEI